MSELENLVADLDAESTKYQEGFYKLDTNRKMVAVPGFTDQDVARYTAKYPSLSTWLWVTDNEEEAQSYLSGASFAEPLPVLDLSIFTTTKKGFYSISDLASVFGRQAIAKILQSYGAIPEIQETLEFITGEVATQVIKDYYNIYD